jgi:hypothetical protein
MIYEFVNKIGKKQANKTTICFGFIIITRDRYHQYHQNFIFIPSVKVILFSFFRILEIVDVLKKKKKNLKPSRIITSEPHAG